MPGRAVCGLDVGGTKVLAVAFDPADPATVVERRVPTPRDADGLVGALCTLVDELDGAVQSAWGAPGVEAVGLGIAGLVDGTGTLRLGPNLPGIVDVPLRARLAGALDRPVQVLNDATAATWGEHRVGAGAGVDELVLVTLGTGIGGGVVAGGRLVTGRNGFAGEAGHMVVDVDGPLCPCGKRGCWERFASGSGLARLAREAAEAGHLGAVVADIGGDPELVRGEHVTLAAQAGDPEAQAVLDRFAWWVALGVVNLVNLLDPETVVVGGGLVAAGDALLDPVRAAAAELLFGGSHRSLPAIVPAALGERAGALGAGLLALEQPD